MVSVSNTKFFEDAVIPLSGDVFIFLSKTRNKIKLLQWQCDGFAIFYKRLEKGTFELPESDSDVMLLSAQKLMLN